MAIGSKGVESGPCMRALPLRRQPLVLVVPCPGDHTAPQGWPSQLGMSTQQIRIGFCCLVGQGPRLRGCPAGGESPAQSPPARLDDGRPRPQTAPRQPPRPGGGSPVAVPWLEDAAGRPHRLPGGSAPGSRRVSPGECPAPPPAPGGRANACNILRPLALVDACHEAVQENHRRPSANASVVAVNGDAPGCDFRHGPLLCEHAGRCDGAKRFHGRSVKSQLGPFQRLLHLLSPRSSDDG
jgi:hypothetical protein